MKLTSTGFEDGATLPSRLAFAKPHPTDHVELTDNRNPQLAWSDVPEATRSFALLCHDPDCPSKPDDVNQEGRSVPTDLPRVDFYHWVLVDIPASATSLEEGSHSDGITNGGKPGPDAAGGTRHGLNNYTQWFEGDADMRGQYHGYDGPCPPWNDEITHHYHFTLYALDVDRCPVEAGFDGPGMLKAIEGHVLAKASLMGTYCLNPDVG